MYILYNSQQRILLGFCSRTVELCSTLIFPKSNFYVVQLKQDCVHSCWSYAYVKAYGKFLFSVLVSILPKIIILLFLGYLHN